MVCMMEQAIHSMDEENGVGKMTWLCDLAGTERERERERERDCVCVCVCVC